MSYLIIDENTTNLDDMFVDNRIPDENDIGRDYKIRLLHREIDGNGKAILKFELA